MLLHDCFQLDATKALWDKTYFADILRIIDLKTVPRKAKWDIFLPSNVTSYILLLPSTERTANIGRAQWSIP